ncbi:killer protein of pyocin s3 [Salmonella enterica]|nr:killer protein of pyocin s3 [Salmonella enterica]EBB7908380.1 killer protein of pyocin s3 [Salmonella enterica]EBK3282582.1 killer protein of pyocin s3 [Salmonella enterica]
MGQGYFLVRGDKTTCGGKIIEGADDHTIMGIPQAREMDKVTCGKHSGIYQIVGGVPQTDIHGRLMAGTLDSKSSCPCKAKFIASMMDDVYESGGGDGGGDSAQDNHNNDKRGEQHTSPVNKNLTAGNSNPSVTPVFAKSCLRGSGCTDAGTVSEPAENFGKIGFFQASAAATIINQGVGNGVRAFMLQAIEGSAARAASVRLAAPNPWVIGFVGIFWSEKLNSGEQDFIDNMRLMQLATQKGSATTRLRFQWATNGITGKPEVRGYHTGGDGRISDQVPVREMTYNIGKGVYEFWEDGAKGPTLLWTPDNPGFTTPSDTGNDDVFVPPPSILILPEPTETGGYTETLPMPDEKSFRDYILVHPEGAFEPIYVYLSKSPVKLLEVDLYRNFDGRSREGLYAADHMPSAAAVKAYLRRRYPDATSEELNSMAKDVAAMIIPAEVHRKISETYGGRNSTENIERDSMDLRAALDRNFDAVVPSLKEYGATDPELEQARKKMHELNQKQGLY